MTRQLSRRMKVRVFGAFALFIVVTFLIVLAATAQQERYDRPSARNSTAPALAAGLTVRPPHHPLRLEGGTAGRVASAGSSLSFLSPLSFDVGDNSAYSVAVADVNGDGKPDLIIGTKGNDAVGGGVSVLLGDGDGTFSPAVRYDSGGSFAKVAVADVNGDGKLDILVADECDHDSNCRTSVVGVLLGNGDGTFQPVATYNAGGFEAHSIAVADVNGDGKPDLMAALCSSGNTECGGTDQAIVTVLLGNGDGTFQTAIPYSTGGYGEGSVAVADVNGDGKPDLVTANNWAQPGFVGEGVLGVLLGNGDGTFKSAVGYASGGYAAISAGVADVNGDGKLDIVVANSCGTKACLGYASVGVLLGNGDGTFKPAITYNTGGIGAVSEAIADLDGDGKLDLLVANESDTVGVLLGNGDGSFQAATVYNSGGLTPRWVTVADVNGDGAPDVAVGNDFANLGGSFYGDGLVGVLLNNTASTLHPTTTILSSSLNPSFAGQSVTFTAVASSTAGIPPNGGKVTFYFYGAPGVVGTGLLSVGTASVTTSSLPTATTPVVAIYSGGGNYGPSMSSVLQQVVNFTTKSATATTLVSSLNPSVYGQKVTWTATVTTSGSVAPTGTVKFIWSGHSIGTATLNSNGVATLTRSNLNADAYPLTAVYVGDASNLGSTSAVVSQVVTHATSSATLTASPNPSTSGQAVTFTATITSPTVTPTGPVTFAVGTTVLGTAQLSGGKAKFTTSTLAVGSTKVTATYYGDSNIAKSSASVTQTVQ